MKRINSSEQERFLPGMEPEGFKSNISNKEVETMDFETELSRAKQLNHSPDEAVDGELVILGDRPKRMVKIEGFDGLRAVELSSEEQAAYTKLTGIGLEVKSFRPSDHDIAQTLDQQEDTRRGRRYV